MSPNSHVPIPTPGPLCAAYAPALALLGSDALPPEEARTVKLHVVGCAWCQAKLAGFEVVEAALRRQYGVEAAPGAMPSLEDIMSLSDQASSNQEERIASFMRWQPPQPARRRPPALVAVAAVLLIVAMAGALFGLFRPGSGQPAVGHHATTTMPTCPHAAHPMHKDAVFALEAASHAANENVAPEYLTCGPDGNIWVAADGGVYRLTPTGSVTQMYQAPSVSVEAVGITTGSDGNIWFTMIAPQGPQTAPQGVVARMTPSGQVTQFALPLTTRAQVWAANITTGPDGNLWFGYEVQVTSTATNGTRSSTYSDFIARITPQGQIASFPLPIPQDSPEDLVAGPDGNVWFTSLGGANRPGTIGRITPRGEITQFPVSTDVNAAPHDITLGPDGNLWVTVSDTGPCANPPCFVSPDTKAAIGRMTPSGKLTLFPVTNRYYLAIGITSGPDGNLWFTLVNEVENNNAPLSPPVGPNDGIGRITTSGVVKTRFSLLGGTRCQPFGLITGPDGNLWISEQNGIGGTGGLGGAEIERLSPF